MDKLRCDWDSRDFEEDTRWQGPWAIWELLILRHNNGTNGIPKEQTKDYLNPLLVLNKKSIKFKRGKNK